MQERWRNIFLWFPPYILAEGLVKLTQSSLEMAYFGKVVDVYAPEFLGNLLWTLFFQVSRATSLCRTARTRH